MNHFLPIEQGCVGLQPHPFGLLFCRVIRHRYQGRVVSGESSVAAVRFPWNPGAGNSCTDPGFCYRYARTIQVGSSLPSISPCALSQAAASSASCSNQARVEPRRKL